MGDTIGVILCMFMLLFLIAIVAIKIHVWYQSRRESKREPALRHESFIHSIVINAVYKTYSGALVRRRDRANVRDYRMIGEDRPCLDDRDVASVVRDIMARDEYRECVRMRVETVESAER